MNRCRSLPAAIAAVVVSAVLAACGGDNNNSGAALNPPTITTLSNRADLVSGGDVLVEIKLAAGVAPSSLVVSVNGTDVGAGGSGAPPGPAAYVSGEPGSSWLTPGLDQSQTPFGNSVFSRACCPAVNVVPV